MDLRFKTFSDEVRRHFDFLLTQYGFTGPIEDNRPAPLDRLMTYASSAVTVNVGLALGPASDQSVNTWLELRTPDESISVDLEEVFGAARLGPVNSVGTGAQTRHAMSKSIAAQGGALREVLPVVLAPAGAVLMQGTRRSLRRPLRRSPGVGG